MTTSKMQLPRCNRIMEEKVITMANLKAWSGLELIKERQIIINIAVVDILLWSDINHNAKSTLLDQTIRPVLEIKDRVNHSMVQAHIDIRTKQRIRMLNHTII
jgi:hypothetical protein